MSIVASVKHEDLKMYPYCHEKLIMFLKFQTTPSWHQFSAWLTIFVRNAIWPNSSKIIFITSFLPYWDVNDNDPQFPEISTLISYQAVVVIRCVKRYTSTIEVHNDDLYTSICFNCIELYTPYSALHTLWP